MMNISFTMFNNYHIAAKEYAAGNMEVYGRLLYIINMYAIEGVLIEDITPAEKLFITSIKASIDKSIRLSEAGRKGGSRKSSDVPAAENPEEEAAETETECIFDSNNEACKPFQKACNEEEEEIETDTDIDLDKDTEIEQNKKQKESAEADIFSMRFGYELTNQHKNIIIWLQNHSFKINAKNQNYILLIAYYMNHAEVKMDFLDYVYDVVKSVYKKINLGIFYNAFSWENTLIGYKTCKKAKEKTEEPKAPKNCTVCGAKLVPGGIPNSVECPECLKAGNRIWWELDPKLKRWIQSK